MAMAVTGVITGVDRMLIIVLYQEEMDSISSPLKNAIRIDFICINRGCVPCSPSCQLPLRIFSIVPSER